MMQSRWVTPSFIKGLKGATVQKHCKLLLAIGGALTALLIALLIGSKVILLDSFLDIEKNDMKRNVERVMNALQGELSQLSTSNSDYAGWDDSYQFIQDGNKEYIEKNIPDTVFSTLRINLLMYVTNDGRIVYARSFDRQEGKAIELPEGLLKHISAKSLLVQHPDTQSTVNGILSLPERLFLISSKPILTNEFKGPIHGALIMGRYLDDEEVKRLADTTKLSLTIYRSDKQEMPDELMMARDVVSESQPVWIHPLNKKTVAAYTLVKDIYGKGVLIAKIDVPRDIYLQGIATIQYIIFWFLTVGLIFSVISYLLFDNLVFLRRKEKESEDRYRSVVKQASEGILIVSVDNKRIIEGNTAFHGLIGYTPEEAAQMTLYDIVLEERDKVDSEAERILEEKREMRLRHKDGSFVDVELSANQIPYKDQEVMCLVVHDITERKRFVEQLMHQANHDSLTGLANRNLLKDRLNQAIAYQKRKNQIIAVMLLDLDDFKIVNDTLGHQAGDLLLKDVAQRLQGSVRSYDTVARLGGDEFVIIITDVTNTQDIITITKNILNLFSTSFKLNEQEIFITTSIGISLYPLDGDNIEYLLMKADTALYHSKGQGRNNYHFFAGEMNKKVSDRLVMETRLRKAIEGGELLLHYQPKVELTDGRICGMEALIRWQHPESGIISPAEFIPLAEETGMIIPIGEFALRTACRQTKQWHDMGYPSLRISVNLSARQFAQDNLVDTVKDILQETGFDPNYLDLELTESILIQNEEKIIRKLNALREMGITLSLDDFGTGYSSLSYLKKFPIGEVKIDRSFVRDINNNPDDAALVEAILSMTRSLKLKTVAEGVETLDQLNFLIEHNCGAIQGFYFSRPLPAESFTELLSSKKQLDMDYSRTP